jgi:hypothetical protein
MRKCDIDWASCDKEANSATQTRRRDGGTYVFAYLSPGLCNACKTIQTDEDPDRDMVDAWQKAQPVVSAPANTKAPSKFFSQLHTAYWHVMKDVARQDRDKVRPTLCFRS